ncbi:MAG: DoxX family protein [Bacteroidota bacterium]
MKQLIMQVLSATLPDQKRLSAIILGFRVLIAFAMIRTHGWKKVVDFEGTVQHIPDPFGMGGLASTYISIIVNVGLAGLVAIGLFTRASAIGILSLTLSGFFLVHFNDPWPVKDVPLMYSLAYTLILLVGPGQYSIDHLISKKLNA